ncbi:hypothetical protein TNIN_262461 [Trichonephila inaurata madagascariensis]|uniref:Uncharacterized protein n=1 Tax=Trichonephila inaurata madagascariensis TaxID=2747483 RepID=A0A8X6IT28_9ARAC|nr:hypothetical protein TNIN_262461 [Trichonephila inaurata madagascariensis]
MILFSPKKIPGLTLQSKILNQLKRTTSLLYLNKTWNNRSQLIPNKIINENFPDIKNKTSCEFIKLCVSNDDEQWVLFHALVEGSDFEYPVIKPKPIKTFIKSLLVFSKVEDIQNDLEEIGYTVTSCIQLISKKTGSPLPSYYTKKSE